MIEVAKYIPSVVRKSGASLSVHEYGGLSVYSAWQMLSKLSVQSVVVNAAYTSSSAGHDCRASRETCSTVEKCPAHDCGTSKNWLFW